MKELQLESMCLKEISNYTHIQYTRSVSGRKRGDASRRIATDRDGSPGSYYPSRIVTDGLDRLTPEVTSRKGIAEVNFR